MPLKSDRRRVDRRPSPAVRDALDDFMRAIGLTPSKWKAPRPWPEVRRAILKGDHGPTWRRVLRKLERKRLDLPIGSDAQRDAYFDRLVVALGEQTRIEWEVADLVEQIEAREAAEDAPEAAPAPIATGRPSRSREVATVSPEPVERPKRRAHKVSVTYLTIDGSDHA